MDIASQVVGALVAGATVAGKDVASEAVKDAYAALKNGVIYLFGARADAAVKSIQADPDSVEAQKALVEVVGAVAQADVERLEQKIIELMQAIEAASNTQSEAGEGSDLVIAFKNIKDVTIGGINAQGHTRAELMVSEGDRFTGGMLNFTAKPGK